MSGVSISACPRADETFPTITPHDLRHTAASLAVSAHANVKAVQRMLGRIKARVPGSTINDVTLAYVGGALRGYLNRHDELPDQTLVAACPISLRDTGDTGSGGNMLFGRLQQLETTTADALDRLAIIAEATAAFRATSDRSTNTQLLDLVGTVPTALSGRRCRLRGCFRSPPPRSPTRP
jgi:hypothetical protein